MDELRRLRQDAPSLAPRIDQHFLQGKLVELQISRLFASLPTQLTSMANILTYSMSQGPKPGQASKVARSELLVSLSEFVKSKTGKYNDLALTELLQRCSLETLTSQKIQFESDALV